MISQPASRFLRLSIANRFHFSIPVARQFSTTKVNSANKNRIYDVVRRPDDFESYLLLSTSSRKPLITFWTASYCNTCRTVSPIITSLLESGVGESEGGVSFCEIEYDAQDIMDSGFGMRYMITSMPTLLSFDGGEAQTQSKLVDPNKMRDAEFMREWIRNEARKRGGGSGGSGSGGGLFGGLFGNSK